MPRGVDRQPRDTTRLWRALRKLLAGGLAHSHVSNQTPVGAMDGINATFTLASRPRPTSLQVFKNGLLMTAGEGNDYVLADRTITFSPGQVPAAGENVRCWYIVA